MKAVICPICQGEGTISRVITALYPRLTDAKICRGCDGKGWVCVPDTIPINPQPDWWMDKSDKAYSTYSWFYSYTEKPPK